MSAGKIRISQSAEAAIQAWFQLAPIAETEPGVRAIELGKINSVPEGYEIRTVRIESYGKTINVLLTKNEGKWKAVNIEVTGRFDTTAFRPTESGWKEIT